MKLAPSQQIRGEKFLFDLNFEIIGIDSQEPLWFLGPSCTAQSAQRHCKYEQVWSSMSKYDQVWASMIKYEQVWSSMSEYDQVWASMINYEQVWSSMSKYDQVWASMIKYEQVWASMSKYDQVWASMIKYEQVWSSMSVRLTVSQHSSVIRNTTSGQWSGRFGLRVPLQILLTTSMFFILPYGVSPPVNISHIKIPSKEIICFVNKQLICVYI